MTTTLDGTAVKEVATLAQQAAIPHREGINGYEFSDRTLHRIDLDPKRPETLEFYTLDGFVDFLKSEPAAATAMVQVANPTLVFAISALEGQDTHNRRTFARACCKSATLHGFSFNAFFPLETLTIALQTCFEPEAGEVQNLRKFCASVRSSQEVGVADDGVSQTVQAKRGVAAVTNVAVQNPWGLAPWRTFSEVLQPVSPFILRFAEREGPTAGLFETGDARWQVDAVRAIAEYLRNRLAGRVVLG